MKYIVLFTLALCSSGIYAMGEERTETTDSTPDPVIQMPVDDTQATESIIVQNSVRTSDDADAQGVSNSGCILCTSKDKVNVKHAQLIQWGYRTVTLCILVMSSWALSDLDEENSSRALVMGTSLSVGGSAALLGVDALKYCIEKLSEE